MFFNLVTKSNLENLTAVVANKSVRMVDYNKSSWKKNG